MARVLVFDVNETLLDLRVLDSTSERAFGDAAVRQLSNAGVAPLLDEIMSVETSGKFKPARVVYEMAATQLGVTTAQMRMVAAHDWDIAGAMRAGCAGAYLLRAGMVLNPLYPRPDIVEADFHRLAERIVEVEKGETS
ncbi:MAG: hypothetical protein WBN29_18070 [Polyangiales bacterium]